MALALGLNGAEAASSPKLVEKVTRLGTLPESGDRSGGDWLTISPDKGRLAFVKKRDGMQVVVVDGSEGGAFDRIDLGQGPAWPGGAAFSADSKRVLYRGQRGDVWSVVVDREVGPGFASIPQAGFMPDGAAYYVGRAKDGWRLVVGDRETSLPTNLLPGDLRVHPDGTAAYVVSAGQRQHAVIGEKQGPAYDSILRPGVTFGPRGKRWWYAASQGKQSMVVVEDEVGKPYDSVGAVRFSGNELRAAHYARRAGKWIVVVDGEDSPPCDNVLESGVQLSPNGARVGYACKQGSTWRVVINGEDGPVYEGIALGSPVFSPDSRRNAYVASRGRQAIAVIDGKEGPPVHRIPGNVVFSPDSRRAAYTTRGDPAPGGKPGFAEEWRVVVDGVEGPSFGSIDEKRPPLFSPDSAHLAYVATKDRKKVVVLDGKVLGPFDDVEPRSLGFSPDSRHLVWAAARKGKWALIVDGQETETVFQKLLAPDAVGWDGPSRVHAIVGDQYQGGEAARIDVDVAG